jgi:uncharacterized membrane protein
VVVEERATVTRQSSVSLLQARWPSRVTALATLNDELAAVGPDPSGVAIWERYARVWRAWNHLRVAAALAAAGLLIVALTR